MNITKHEKNNILLQFWVKETPFKKKKVSVWHTMKLTSRLWLPKNSGSLHIMIFRYCGNISVSMQRYFLKVKGVKKFMFRCHTLTHGTDLRRLPQLIQCLSLRLSPGLGLGLFPGLSQDLSLRANLGLGLGLFLGLSPDHSPDLSLGTWEHVHLE